MNDTSSNSPQSPPQNQETAIGQRRPLWPMDPQLKDIQPGGGIIIHLELWWGGVRRACLKTFFRSYLQRMADCRKGNFNPCPHDVIDPRDLKFYRNQGGWYWDPDDDPFRWRERLPFARVGLAELLVMCGMAFAGTAAFLIWAQSSTGIMRGLALFLALSAAVIGILIAWFFRNPRRSIPQEPGQVVSPADGKVVDIERLSHDDFIGGPSVKIGIFLSIFNVHINRSPVAGKVIGLKYRPGKYLNALRPESARENEQLAIMIEEDQAPYRGMVVRQITGAIARRIVCWLKPGDSLGRGEQFGMIKLGSRTELVIPDEEGLEIHTKLGDKVLAGTSVLARYEAKH